MITNEQLIELNSQRTYTEEDQQVAFLLGGIGTGNVSLGSRGEFRDWEIFNNPEKGHRLANTWFAIYAKEEGEPSVCKVLEASHQSPHQSSHGYHPVSGAGLPRLEHSEFRGEYPFASVKFEDRSLPVQIELKAFNPFIPLNPEDSGIPGVILTYRVKNITHRKVEVSIAGSLINAVGEVSYNEFGKIDTKGIGGNLNEIREENGVRGLYMHSLKYAPDHLKYGNLSLLTRNSNGSFKKAWYRGTWYDYLQEFWDDFSKDGMLTDLGYNDPSADGQTDTGSIAVSETLQPGESKEIQFILTWYFPNRINGWNETVRKTNVGAETARNYYAKLFDSSWSAATYMVSHYERLKRETESFHQALFSSTFPSYVLDAVSSNITVLRSPTCFWLEDGRFFGYEGCFDHGGCCAGTCTHVWNYAQTLAFLFPTLEQTMRHTEYIKEMDQAGKLNMRAFFSFDYKERNKLAAVDGQMGSIMRVYREWKLSGNQKFLIELWPYIKKALDFALIHWDSDGDEVLDNAQHNTYDINFHGPNPLGSVFFLGALRAAEEMALYLREPETAATYRGIFDRSSAKANDLMWNGEFYEQKLEGVNEFKYQHGAGCLSDQMFAQQLAHLYGLGYLLPEDRVKSSVQAIFKYNFRTTFQQHANCQRVYALNDEEGLLLCSWPNGGRPNFPFVYSDEVWTGIEYQVATHLIFEGFVEEGLTIVKAVRDRYDGRKRNPWDEVECGHHYARSMASWGLMISLSGFTYDMVCNEIRFDPKIHREQFQTFWSTGKAWGTYKQWKHADKDDYEFDVVVLYGDADDLKVVSGNKIIIL